MQPLVIFHDAVDLLIQYLQEELDVRGMGAEVVPRVPIERPVLFALVRRSGGVKRNVITDEATIIVESWADSDQEAQDLCQLCRGLIQALPGAVVSGVPFYRVSEFSGPAFLPDPLSSQSRYTQTFSVALRGAESVSGS